MGVDYDKTTAPKDVLDMVEFMKKFYNLSSPDVNILDKEYSNIYKTKEQQRRGVDRRLLQVND